MELKHTPGPWKVVGQTHSVKANNGELQVASVQSLPGCGMLWDEKIKGANARLIAAAPDLLAYAICEDAIWGDSKGRPPFDETLARYGYDPVKHITPGQFLDEMRAAAIAKATASTGGQS